MEQEEEECYCLEDISEIEIMVLETQGKRLMCDSTCVDGTDLIWGEIWFGRLLPVGRRGWGGDSCCARGCRFQSNHFGLMGLLNWGNHKMSGQAYPVS